MTKDLSTVSLEGFGSCLGETFLVPLENNDNLVLELIEVKAIGHFDPERDAREAFSVLFRGPGDLLLAQGLFHIENTELGALPLFLVPLGSDDEGMLYDATFN
jgi:hypothetical protein